MNARSNFSSVGNVGSVSAAGPTTILIFDDTPAYSKLSRATYGQYEYLVLTKTFRFNADLRILIKELAGDNLTILGHSTCEPNGGVPT